MINKSLIITFAILIVALNSKAQVTGSFTDSRDGHVYKTVTIGTQTWMAENLAYKASSGCYAYNEDVTNVTLYGYLYNWETAKKTCPDGWHLPTDEEWTLLTKNLGGEKVAGGKLKAISSWQSPNIGADNSSGFTALPGGMGLIMAGLYNSYNFIGTYGIWWSATVFNKDKTWNHFIINKSANFSYDTLFDKNSFLSVRCIKNSTDQVASSKIQSTTVLTGQTENSFTDPRDGKVYKTFKINDVQWMSKNLEATTFRNGDAIPEIKNQKDWQKAYTSKTPAWCYFKNDKKNGITYGKLYNFWAVADPRGLAPKGWHVSTNEEWTELVNSSGGENFAGNELQGSPGQSTSGFDAPMGSMRTFIDFEVLNKNASYWTSTEKNSSNAIMRYIPDRVNNIYTHDYSKGDGMSVRCVKD
jgi:uncharacterized protein (TIGR02145 family)